MRINEVEALVGITEKNIRFCEEQGMLSPKRNSENSYREYGEEEMQTLRRIKLLREPGVPIEQIRQMFGGSQTVAASDQPGAGTPESGSIHCHLPAAAIPG